MKILHITPDFNFANKFVKPVCTYQANMGHNVKVISTGAFYQAKNDAAKLLESFSEGNSNLQLEILNLRLRKLEWSLVTSYLDFIKLVRREKFDVIISHTTVDTALPLMLVKVFSNSKRIYFNHGVPALGYKGFTMSILNFVERVNIKLANQVFTIGKSMSQALKTIKSDVNPIFIEPGSACGVRLITESFSKLQQMRVKARRKKGISENDRIIIYVGRPVRRKGIFDLIEAWQLMKREENWHLLLIGLNVEEINQTNLEKDNISAVGYIEDVTDYYLCADVLCVPSYHEGLGYTYLEAAAAGCVPVSSNISGPTDFVVEGVTGFTVNPGCLNEIVNILEKLIMDDARRKELSKNAFLKVMEYDQRVIAPKIAQRLLLVS